MPHTPGPWQHRPNIGICAPDGREIARTIVAEPSEKSDYEEAWANARFIVLACNTHADLLAGALEAFRIAADNAELFQRYGNEAGASVYLLIVDTLREALAKATKEEP